MKRLLLVLVILTCALPLVSFQQPHAEVLCLHPTAETVYITKTGEKYHRGTCGYLSKSKIAIPLDEAKASGYTPCSRCKPPR
jgi:hypothetical protein